jgi:hypothetical protein
VGLVAQHDMRTATTNSMVRPRARNGVKTPFRAPAGGPGGQNLEPSYEQMFASSCPTCVKVAYGCCSCSWASGSGDFAAGPATRQEHALVAFGFVHLKPLWHLGDGRRAGLICSLSPGRDQQVRRNTEPRVGEQVQRG